MAAVNWIRKTVIWKKESNRRARKKKAIAGDNNAHKNSKILLSSCYLNGHTTDDFIRRLKSQDHFAGLRIAHSINCTTGKHSSVLNWFSPPTQKLDIHHPWTFFKGNYKDCVFITHHFKCIKVKTTLWVRQLSRRYLTIVWKISLKEKKLISAYFLRKLLLRILRTKPQCQRNKSNQQKNFKKMGIGANRPKAFVWVTGHDSCLN